MQSQILHTKKPPFGGFEGSRELTAAAANEDEGDDENPNPVVIKNVAQTVIHGKPPYMKCVRGFPPYTIILCRSPSGVHEKMDFLSRDKTRNNQGTKLDVKYCICMRFVL